MASPRGAAGTLHFVKTWHWALASTFPAGVFALLTACGSFSSEVPAEGVDAGASEAGPAVDAPSEATAADAEVDAGGDAAGLACATRSDDPLMCADFDDMPTPRVYSEGTPSDVQQLTNRKVEPTGRSLPNAMWSDSRNDNVPQLTVSGTTNTTRVRVALDVFVEPYGAEKVDGALVRVGVSPNLCFVEVRLLPGRLLLQTHCLYTDDAGDGGDFYRSQELLANPISTSKWVHVELDVNYAASTASAALDGKVKPSLDLNPSATPGGTPYVDVGINLDKVRVGFDNVLAIASK